MPWVRTPEVCSALDQQASLSKMLKTQNTLKIHFGSRVCLTQKYKKNSNTQVERTSNLAFVALRGREETQKRIKRALKRVGGVAIEDR